MNHLVTGDKGKSKGAFQVQERHWGKVPKTMKGQMEQHDKILVELLESVGETKGIMAYNGSGYKAKRYYKKVRKQSFELFFNQNL
jgi:hypothetical protein